MNARDALHYALDTARGCMPPDTHPIYFAQLGVIREIVTWAMKTPEAASYWERKLRAAERAIDEQARQR